MWCHDGTKTADLKCQMALELPPPLPLVDGTKPTDPKWQDGTKHIITSAQLALIR